MDPFFLGTPLHEEFPKTELKAVMESMRTVLKSWVYLPSGHIGRPVDGPARLSLERSVSLEGDARAFVTIRTVPQLGSLLCQYATGDPCGPEEGEDAFYEFVNIFCGHLVTYLWGSEGKVFQTYLPVPTTPADWPNAAPSVACAFITEDLPIEVRLWIKDNGPAKRAGSNSN
jgi:hypothetical protein